MQDEETRSDAASAECATVAVEGVADEWLGRVLDDRYRILERLGEGGMGAVFIAEHTKLFKRVALKVIHPHFAGNDEIAARFAREAMTSAHVEHPNVASALDFGSLPEGGAYLVMQLVRGPSLSEHLAQHGALSASEACQIAAQIADAVAAAHASGIVHRDLKPDNVVLMPNEDGTQTVKVLDFGIAHVKAQNQAPTGSGRVLTRVGVVIGTPGYMPPEQATGQPVDERADLYALGVILWELLMGTAPFQGETFSEIVTRQLHAPGPQLTLSAEHAPEALRALIRALLERNPADRPKSAAEVRDALRTLALQGGTARREGAWPVRASGAPTTWSTLRTTSQSWKTLPSGWRMVFAAMAVLATAFALRSWMTGEVIAKEPTQVGTKVERASARAENAASPTAPKPVSSKKVGVVDSGDSEGSKAAVARESSKHGKTRSKSERGRPVQRLRRALDNLLE